MPAIVQECWGISTMPLPLPLQKGAAITYRVSGVGTVHPSTITPWAVILRSVFHTISQSFPTGVAGSTEHSLLAAFSPPAPPLPDQDSFTSYINHGTHILHEVPLLGDLKLQQCFTTCVSRFNTYNNRGTLEGREQPNITRFQNTGWLGPTLCKYQI